MSNENDADEDEDSLLGTSALRGILLLGGVATLGFFAWKYWRTIKISDVPHQERLIRVPVELPLPPQKKK